MSSVYETSQNKTTMRKKNKIWVNVILTVIVLILIGLNSSKFNTSIKYIVIDRSQPNYQISNSITHIYTAIGKLSYKLITDEIHQFSKNKISWFINPILTTYDIMGTPIWAIRANKAKLTNTDMLYLYGNVQLNILNSNSDLQKILMENATFNLITQDFLSNNKVTIIGIGLRSVSMKMHGNMRTNTAELIKDVETYYEILNKKKF
ncbi:MAG: LPS export ABC transporter periplasmic protein LptC [Arsenophonus sp. ER-LPS3-MAG3]